jgi:hypothetical protein
MAHSRQQEHSMSIPASGTFNYLVEVPADVMGPWQAKEVRPSKLTGDPLCDSRLVGLSPEVLIAKGRITLKASGRERAALAAAAFEVDPRLVASVRGGDLFYMVRTAACGLGLSVLRASRLVVAVGAVTKVPLCSFVQARNDWALAREAEALFQRKDPHFCLGLVPMEITIGSQTRLMCGESWDLEGYQVAMESQYFPGEPGCDENVSITCLDLCPRAGGVLSARLLARHGLAMVQW